MIIWLASYPRSGNTLLRMIFKQCFERETYSKYNDLFDIGADPKTAELVGHRMLEEPWETASARMRDAPELNLVKTHDPPEDDVRAIYVTRDGRSASISYHKYLKNFKQQKDAWSISDVIAGLVPYGSWSSHLDSWNPQQRPNTLLLRFEDLLAAKDEQIARIAEFCGLQPLHGWQNDFEKAHEVNPTFFRQGSADRAISDLVGEDLELFWELHHDWMARLGYVDRPPETSTSPMPIRRKLAATRDRLELISARLEYQTSNWTQLLEHRDSLQVRTDKAERQAYELGQALERANWEMGEKLARIAWIEQQLTDATRYAREQEAVVKQHWDSYSEASTALEAARRQSEVDREGLRVSQETNATLQAKSAEDRLRLDGQQAQIAERDATIAGHQAESAAQSARLAAVEAQLAWYRQPLHVRWSKVARNYATHLLVGWPHGRRRRTDQPLPRMTIVTPCYNSQETIRHTIESVLGQRYPNLEYIISDGGSTDDTIKIVNQYRDRLARVISGPDGGMYDAIAKGFDGATGEIFAYLNSDDLYEAGGLIRAGEYFRDHPSTQVVFREDTVTMDGWRFPNNVQPPFIDRRSLLKGYILFQDGVFFRRSAYEAVGGVNRQMRRAGDWDLWVRLAGKFRFRRAPEHVSSFRVRKGQISEDMNSYYAEITAMREQWRGKINSFERLLSLPGHVLGRALNLLWRRRRRRLYFPLASTGIGYGFGPSPGKGPAPIVDEPICPLTERFPDRLLFSSRDTRFGDERIHYVYHCHQSHLALTYPPMTREQLNELYEKYYSAPPTQVIPPPEGHVSPYRNFFGGGWLDRLVLKAVLPVWACRQIRWDDPTLDELLANTPSVPRRGGDVSMLDLGCFEGKFLELVASATDWKTFGLEPNANAVAVARAKGHHVYQGYAEDAVFVIPDDHRFDLIFMGQTIEHVDEPLTVVRRLLSLLKPDGRLVMSTPNLDAKQIELFGPTWSHWHLPYHRSLFSAKSLRLLGDRAGLELVSARTYSHPYWTCLSVQLNKLGVGAAVSHAIPFGQDIVRPALSLTAWSKWLWDWRGRGDYLFAVFRQKL